ncbi:hypothetical protein V5O48_015577 [Marasmius crinis-equi]|uniref:Protein-S-isoprenylcysteine O-methyltransferase n=1 Tax=Marasmius crinis-equi TaxID=585013 RepID=A0ABR3EUH5_9AGAR
MLSVAVILRLALVILSSWSFGHTVTPPSGRRPTVPTTTSNDERGRREWWLIFVAARVFPVFRVSRGYMSCPNFELTNQTARVTRLPYTLNEALFILSTHSPDLTSHLVNYRTSIGSSPSLWPLLFLASTIAGVLVREACYRAFKGKGGFTFGQIKPGVNPHLITHGPYSIVRHPGYTGQWMVVVGITCYHILPGSWLHENWLVCSPFILVWIVMMFRHMVFLTMRAGYEDEHLKKDFGEEWERWRKLVRYKLVPGLY